MIVGTSELKRVLAIAGMIVPSKSIIYSYEEVLVESKPDKTTVSASNGFSTIKIDMDAETKVAVNFCMKFSLLSKLVSLLPEEPITILPAANGGATLSTSTGKHTIPGENVGGWASIKADSEMIELPPFSPEQVGHASRFTHKDEMYNTCNVMVVYGAGEILITGTDGHAFVGYTTSVDSDVAHELKLMPETAKVIVSVWDSPDSVRVSEKCAIVEGGGVEYTFILPDKAGYNTSIPSQIRETVKSQFVIERNELISAIKRVSIHDDNGLITLNLLGQVLHVETNGAKESLPIEYDGGDVEVLIKGTLVTSIIRLMTGKNVTIQLGEHCRENEDGEQILVANPLIYESEDEGVYFLGLSMPHSKPVEDVAVELSK